MKIVTVDCQYIFPEFAAAYLIVSGGRAAIVDNNTAHSVPLILDALKKEELTPEDVDYVIVTHVHLDHAGGSSLLMKSCPNAKLLAHPRATRHLINPEKLISSAKKVYGENEFEKLYGKIEPIPAGRVVGVEDGQSVSWPDEDGAELRFLHTRGHANHHFCITLVEFGEPQAIFTGDAFGLRYPALQSKGLFVFPSTSPTDFDAHEARESVRKIVAVGAPIAYPTHFGPVNDVVEASWQMLHEIDFSEQLLNDAISSGKTGEGLIEFCESRVRSHTQDIFSKRGMAWDQRAQELLDLDLKLNAAGIAFVAEKKLNKEKETTQ